MPLPAASVVALIDTGAILAIIDREDRWHPLCLDVYHRWRLPFFTTQAVLAETFHLAKRKRLGPGSVWRLLSSGAIEMSPLTNEELPPIQALMDEYADRPMDFADATLVYVAAKKQIGTILTIDHDDFETYRLPGRKRFTILPSR